jgi:signal transduction histidine kinase
MSLSTERGNVAYRDCMRLVLKGSSARSPSSLVQAWAAPAAGLVFFVAWMAQDTTRYNTVAKAIVYFLLAAMIGSAVRWPWISFAIMIGVPGLQIVHVLRLVDDKTWPTYFAAAIVAFLVGLRSSGAVRYIAIPMLAATAVLSAYCIVSTASWARWTTAGGEPLGSHPRWIEFATVSLAAFGLFAGAWAVGIAGASLRLNRVLQAAESKLEETDFELRLSQDRARISRDVHDSLAHSLAIVVSQAEGALALHQAKPEVAAESLRNIANVGRLALTDVRHLVEQINEDDTLTGWGPTTADVDLLLLNMRNVGMRIEFHVTGTVTTLAPSHEVTVFRIVQEGLTNALKHAGPTSSVVVILDWQNTGLSIQVSSESGTPLVPGGSGSRGIGIRGMKERARLAGGWLTASHDDYGQFVVNAFVPTDQAPHDDAVARLSIDAKGAPVG